MTPIILFIIVIGLYLSIKKPYYYVLLYGLMGSEMGAKGISAFFGTFLPSYTLIMRVLLVLSVFTAILHFKKGSIKSIHSWIKLSIMTTIMMVVMLITDINSLTLLSLFSRITLAIAPFGTGIFIIWLAYAYEINHKRLFLIYSACQCLIAMIVIYGVYFGFPLLSVINAGLYSDEYFYLDDYNSMVAMPSNFYLTFAGKNEHFIRCGQFHNANGLGFAAGMLITLLITRYVEDKKLIHKLVYVFFISLAFLLWCNTGTRGPVIGIFVAIIAYVCLYNKNASTKIMIIMTSFFFFLIVVAFGGNIINYFIGSGANDSFASRQALNNNTLAHLDEFFFFGTAGNLDALFERGIDPHELPLRVLCMYGIIPALLMTVLTILKPMKQLFINRKCVSFYSLGLFFTLLFVNLTNNFAENTLFWISLAELAISINEDVKKQKLCHIAYGY